jgi:hypothetical protein
MKSMSGGNQPRNARVRALGNHKRDVSAGRCAHVRSNTFDRSSAR